MAMVKLFRVTDTNGERWHIAAPSFSRAVEAMSDWENEPHESDDEIVQSVECVESLIHGGNRDIDMMEGHTFLGVPQHVYKGQDWSLSNNMANAINKLLQVAPKNHAMSFQSVDPDAFFAAIDALRIAVDNYEEIPF